MKVEFLNAEYTRARVTRGFWWWKEEAIVWLHEDGWCFEANGELFPMEGAYETICLITEARVAEEARLRRARKEAAWTPVSRRTVPAARLVERGGR